MSKHSVFACRLFCYSSLHHWIYSAHLHNRFVLAVLIHIPVGRELEAFSPQMNESQTTASTNGIGGSGEFASAVKIQQCISECKDNRKHCPLRLQQLCPLMLLQHIQSYAASDLGQRSLLIEIISYCWKSAKPRKQPSNIYHLLTKISFWLFCFISSLDLLRSFS